jgi:hypothetical protein
MPPKASQGYENVHAFQPNRGKKVKVREKSAMETAVGAALAGVCSRCCEQLKWCASLACAVCACVRVHAVCSVLCGRQGASGSARAAVAAAVGAARRGRRARLTRHALHAQEAQVRQVPAGSRRAALVRRRTPAAAAFCACVRIAPQALTRARFPLAATAAS